MKEIKDEKIRESILTTEGNIVIAADAGTGKTSPSVCKGCSSKTFFPGGRNCFL